MEPDETARGIEAAEMGYEQAMRRLEEIVRRLEDANLTLDESLRLFEEGVALSRLCSKLLDDAEHRIERLLEGQDGRTVLVPVKMD